MKVYLAGGMRTAWRDRVTTELPQHKYFDPSRHGLSVPKEYTAWDIAHVDECDLLFAFMAADNPSGIGLALEVGFARGRGKYIIVVNESDSRYMPIVECTADYSCRSLEEGIEHLRALGEEGGWKVLE